MAIRSIGVDDPNVSLFENQYPTPRGMRYNSFVILDQHVAILDTIEPHLQHVWLHQLDYALDGRTPDYLIVHHLEPDHSSAIEIIMERFPSITLVASKQALSLMPQFCHGLSYADRAIAVKDGDTLALGEHKLRFFTAPMVHWPEVIMSYDTTTKSLFSADAFGKFGAVQFADNWVDEARRYYVNIVGKYGPQTQAILRKLSSLEIDTVCSLHGPLLQGDMIAKAACLYDTWSSYRPEADGVLVAYASMYGNTGACARYMACELRQRGAEVVEMNLNSCDQSEAVAQAFRLSRMVLAAPTYDAALYPPMLDFLAHLKMKGYQNRRVALIENGSWAPIAAKIMKNELSAMKAIDIVEPTITLRTAMRPEQGDQIAALADTLLA